MEQHSTIAAIATAPGEAGVAIIRLSGPEAWDIAQSLHHGPRALQAGRIHYGEIRHPETGEVVDDAICLAFKAPRSYTGEDVIEIQCHGGRVIPQRVLALCLEAGAQLASPGEFTRRAFMNGRLNLTQAEAVADAIHADGEALARAATHTLFENSLGRHVQAMRSAIIDVQADIVASVDYPEEVEEPPTAQLASRLQSVLNQAENFLALGQQHQRVREGLNIAILGRPNAGKSSLFNALLAQERSIVTAIAGTTRDVVTETLHVAGIPLTLVDTAGIRDAVGVDAVEAIGIERSLHAAQQAHLILYLIDATTLPTPENFPEEDATLVAKLPRDTPALVLLNKTDALSESQHKALEAVHPEAALCSVKGHHGLREILVWLEAQVQQQVPGAGGAQAAQFCLNRRQLDCLAAMQRELQFCVETLNADANLPLDMLTIPLSDALYHLDALLGIDTTEQVLDEVFSRFCVGK